MHRNFDQFQKAQRLFKPVCELIGCGRKGHKGSAQYKHHQPCAQINGCDDSFFGDPDDTKMYDRFARYKENIDDNGKKQNNANGFQTPDNKREGYGGKPDHQSQKQQRSRISQQRL